MIRPHFRGRPLRCRAVRFPLLVLLPAVLLATVGLVVVAPPASRSAAPAQAPATGRNADIGTLEFIESYPLETDLDAPDLPEAADRWPRILARARRTVDIASFYFSRQGDGRDASAPPGAPDPLVPVLQAVTDAADRGCRVRVLGDGKFQQTYPEVLRKLQTRDGIDVAVLDAERLWDGVLHAKYFLVDDDLLYVGSQNWDWRALSQIRELGALVRHRDLATELRRIFDLDWRLARGEQVDLPPPPTISPRLADLTWAPLLTATGDTVAAALAASPRQALPAGVPWDLPLLVDLIDSANEMVRIQLLSYNASDRQGRYFADLDNALRRAAARGVAVQIVLSNWAKVGYKLPWIQSLAAVANIDVRFSNIPPYSGGFIPFARVEHAKYMVVDGQAVWLGTANWSRGYFYGSRNISLFLQGSAAAAILSDFFDLTWSSRYCEDVDPGADYQPPRRQ